MFGIGSVEVLVVGVVVLLAVAAWRIGSRSAWVRVADDRSVAVTVEALEAPFTRLLSGLPGAQLRMGGHATWTLVVHRPPWWTVIPACLLFPVGLLFLLFREEADLVVTIRATPTGSEIRVVGTTRRSVAEILRRAVAELPAIRRPDPTGVPAP